MSESSSQKSKDRLIVLAEVFTSARDREYGLKDEYELAKLERGAAEESLFQYMDHLGLTSIKLDKKTLYQRRDTYISIKGDIKDEAFTWLYANELGNLIQETVNTRTLTAALKGRVEEGDQEIDDYFNVEIKNRVGVRK